MNKEYRNRLDKHITMNGWDYLTQEETSELRREVKDRAKYHGHVIVPNTNNKATFYKDDRGGLVLRSYTTDVLRLYRGRVYKLWQGYSATTARHIDEFMNMNGYRGICKHDWIMIDKSVKAVKLG